MKWLLVCVALLVAVEQEADRAVGLGEGGLRRSAISAPAPEYPAASLQKKSAGVAVAAVVFGADGKTREVTVLEAPDAPIGDAVKNAVMRWTWKPVTISGRSETYGGRAKLTFYFRIVNGKGQVVSPEFKPIPKRASTSDPPVSHGGHGAGATEIREPELAKQNDAVVLDVGERDAFRRGHRPGAINIPYDELGVRATYELDAKKLHVVDCTRDEREICNIAHGFLSEKGFKVAILVR